MRRSLYFSVLSSLVVSWQEKVAERAKKKEEELEEVVPRSYAARFKILLDKLLPYSLMLLFSLIVLSILGGVGSRTAAVINYLNWTLVGYFALRMVLAFRLAKNDSEFLKQHWFDALLVVPAFTLVQEFKAFTLLESSVQEEEALTGMAVTRNAGIASQITRIVKIIKRSLSF